MPPALAVDARSLVVTFGRTRALDEMDLSVESGEIMGLVGPNGSGKTTFIRVIAGLVAPVSGSVEVLGGPVGPDSLKQTGYMTQSAALYEDLPVVDNLVFFGRLFGFALSEARRRAERTLEVVDLADDARTPVRSLSGGMRQRTNLACALVHDPKLLLLDEPTVGVDPVLRRRLWEHFAELNRSGTTILVTTHIMEEAERCHRVAMLDAGRTFESDSPGELLRRTGTTSIEDAYLVLRSARDGSGS